MRARGRCAAGLVAVALAMLTAPARAEPDYPAIDEAIAAGRLVQARAMLTAIKPVEGEMDRAFLDRLAADLALAEGRNDLAFGLYADVSQKAPENCHAARGTGIAALRLRRLADSVPALERASALCPDDWRVWNALGIAHDLRGDWTKSLAAYRKAIDLQPNSPKLLNNLGYSSLLQRRYGEAAELFGRAAALDPDNRRIRNNLDIALAAQGWPLPRRADDAASQAQRLNNAGYAAFLAGDSRNARAYLSRAILADDVYFGRAAANLALVESGKP